MKREISSVFPYLKIERRARVEILRQEENNGFSANIQENREHFGLDMKDDFVK